ncbi:MAG: DUF92 domain-containing protein, partial [Candidatus Diapherotrites archaeon]|nr:DUF92 domain-containing protein [Candidatus Diapherotrites archaeon]
MFDLMNFAFALLLSSILPAIAYVHRMLDANGSVASAIVIFTVVFSMGVLWFSLLPAFVLIAMAGTAYKYKVKRKKGLAEKIEGRGIANVLANSLAPLVSSVLFFFTQNPAFLLAYVGSIAAATADTTS